MPIPVDSGGGRGNRTPKPKKRKVRRPKPPSPTRQAAAQEKQYASQGRSVEKQANQQRRARVRRQHEAKDVKSAADLGRAPAHVRKQFKDKRAIRLIEKRTGHPVAAPPDVAGREYQRLKGEARAAAISEGPVLKVLEQTTRPLHAIAGAAKEDVKVVKQKGLKHYLVHGAPKAPAAAKRGIQNKDKTTFSEVLKEAGVKNKVVRGAGGLVLDVAADPTTYVTGGGSAAAKQAAVKSAEKTAVKKARKAGLTEEQATRFGDRAAKREAKKPAKGGVTLSFGSVEVPAVRKASQVAVKPVRKVRARRAARKPPSRVRAVVADVNPNLAKTAEAQATHEKLVVAARTARARKSQGERAGVDVAHAIHRKIGRKNYQTVVDAIESGSLKGLSPELAQYAHRLRGHFRNLHKQERRAGVELPKRENYVPRELTPDAIEAVEAAKGKVSHGTVLKPGFTKGRTETRTQAEVRKTDPGRYVEDLAGVVARRTASGAGASARAGLHRAMADAGRPVKRGRPLTINRDHEAVYHVASGKEPREVTDAKELDRVVSPMRLNKKGSKVKGATPQKSVGSGRYVVLNKDLVDRTLQSASPELRGHGVVHAFDKATSGFKRIAIATLGFHIRNLVGDTAQAYLGQSGHRLPGNLRRSAKVLKAAGRQETARRALAQAVEGKGTIKTGRYGNVSYDEVARQLLSHGAGRSGYTARELRELSRSGGVKDVGKVRGALRKGRQALGATRGGEFTKRLTLNREDLPRLATAVDTLRKGGTWEDAASAVSGLHFDYAHLTDFERQYARRFAPFYTWSARNIPLQSRMVVQKPGKYANVQKVREEAAALSEPDQVDQPTKDLYAQLEAAGVKLPGGWEQYLSEWEQRNAGVPISWKGHKFTLSMGLPLQDLNELPGAAGKGQGQEYFQKLMSLANPIGKDPVEYFSNHSFFFRDQLERDTSPNVAAPIYVSKFPESLKKQMGVVKMKDKRSGKMVWAWPGKVDYLAKALPGNAQYVQQLLTPGNDRRGKGTSGKLLAYAGLKSVPIDPTTNAISLAYERQQELQKKLSSLRQQGIGIEQGNATPEYLRLNEQLKIVTRIAYQGKALRGDAVLPTSGGPPKSRKKLQWQGAGGSIKWSDQQSGIKWSDK